MLSTNLSISLSVFRRADWTIEHIFPQSSKLERGFTQEEINFFNEDGSLRLHQLGNLCAVSGSLNSSLSDLTFKEKAHRYLGACNPLSRDLANERVYPRDISFAKHFLDRHRRLVQKLCAGVFGIKISDDVFLRVDQPPPLATSPPPSSILASVPCFTEKPIIDDDLSPHDKSTEEGLRHCLQRSSGDEKIRTSVFSKIMDLYRLATNHENKEQAYSSGKKMAELANKQKYFVQFPELNRTVRRRYARYRCYIAERYLRGEITLVDIEHAIDPASIASEHFLITSPPSSTLLPCSETSLEMIEIVRAAVKAPNATHYNRDNSERISKYIWITWNDALKKWILSQSKLTKKALFDDLINAEKRLEEYLTKAGVPFFEAHRCGYSLPSLTCGKNSSLDSLGSGGMGDQANGEGRKKRKRDDDIPAISGDDFADSKMNESIDLTHDSDSPSDGATFQELRKRRDHLINELLTSLHSDGEKFLDKGRLHVPSKESKELHDQRLKVEDQIRKVFKKQSKDFDFSVNLGGKGFLSEGAIVYDSRIKNDNKYEACKVLKAVLRNQLGEFGVFYLIGQPGERDTVEDGADPHPPKNRYVQSRFLFETLSKASFLPPKRITHEGKTK